VGCRFSRGWHRLQFRVRAVAERFESPAARPLLTTENAAVGTVIEISASRAPLMDANFLQLVALSPNVNATIRTGGGCGREPSGRGAQSQNSRSPACAASQQLHPDGIANTDVDFNTYTFLPSSTRCRVQGADWNLLGRVRRETAQVQYLHKSGTNGIPRRSVLTSSATIARCAALWFTRTCGIGAFQVELSSPLRSAARCRFRSCSTEERLFFMSNYEGQRLRQSGPASLPVRRRPPCARKFLADSCRPLWLEIRSTIRLPE